MSVFAHSPHLICAVAAVALSGVAAAQQAPYQITHEDDPFAEWEVEGSTTFRLDHFSATGDTNVSPHRERGFQGFGDLDVTFNRRYSPYNVVEGQFFGTVTRSDLRSEFDGVIPERGTITWTNGEMSLPFRLSAGDIFTFFTPRTINTSLKGMSLEIQPPLVLFGANHSLQMFAGSRVQTFRDEATFEDEQHAGVSWLMSWDQTDVSLNASRGWRGDDVSLSGDREDQTTVSMAGAITLAPTENHRLLIDAELGYIFGDAIAGGDDEGFGGFLEARGDVGPYFYRALFERYDEAFAPIAGAVQGDRQTIETEFGMRFENGVAVRARALETTDNLTQAVDTRTRTLGVNVSGALPDFLGLTSVNGSLDTFAQQAKSSNGATETINLVANMNINAALSPLMSANLGLLYDDRDDRVGAGDATTRQATLNLSRRFQYGEGAGALTLGMQLRDVDRAAGRDVDIGPSIGVSYRKASHNFSVNANRLFQRPAQNAAALDTTRISAAYDYRTGPHAFRLDASYDGRSPSTARDTDSYQVGATYTFFFQKPRASDAAFADPTPRAPLEDVIRTGQIGARLKIDLLPLGAPIDDTFIMLEDANVLGATPFGRTFVFEERYFDSIFERQQLVILTSANGATLEAAGVVVSTDLARNAADLEDLFTDALSELARDYGTPRVFEEGRFEADAAQAIVAGRLIRIAEWRVPGGILRLGFPQRLDGQVRLELQFRANMPPVQDTRWSIQDVI